MDALISTSSQQEFELDFWSSPKIGSVDIRLPDSSLQYITPIVSTYKVLIPDVQKLIHQEQIPYNPTPNKLQVNQSISSLIISHPFFYSYQNSSAIFQFMDGLGAKKDFIGNTYKQQRIYGYYFGTGNKTAIVQGGLHAREWISPAFVAYLGAFLAGPSDDAKNLLSEFTILLIPLVNIDGYDYTRRSDGARLWRKNMQINNDSTVGIDLNRNYNFKWDTPGGASLDSLNETYRGPYPNAAPETKALSEYLAKVPNKVSFIDIHSYGQAFLYPWGYTCSSVNPDESDLRGASLQGALALARVYDTFYTVGTSCESLYQTSGASDDYAYGVLNVKYAMTIELRDFGDYGFLLPPDQIIPVGTESVAALLGVWQYISTDKNLTSKYAPQPVTTATPTAKASQSAVAAKQYAGDRVYRINVDSEYKVSALENLVQNSSLQLQFWDGGARYGQADLHVPFESLPYTSILQEIGQVWINDVQELINNESNQNSKFATKVGTANGTATNHTLANGTGNFYSSYHDYSEILAYFDNVGTNKTVVGTSYQKNPIYGYFIGSGPQTFIIQGGIHAREWISPATVIYLSQFLRNANFTSKFTFLIVPVVNIDGYNYTRTIDRLWRKNRQPNSDGTVGTDCNRNFDIKWDLANGASTDTMAADYKGTAPNSTPEVASITSFYQTLKNVVGFADFHSYSQLWMYPLGYDCSSLTPDNTDLQAASKLAVTAIETDSTKVYQYGPICKTIYPATGSSTDWAYATLKAKYSLAIELRDTGLHGFILPPDQIIPTGNEIVSAFTSFLNYVANDPNPNRSAQTGSKVNITIAASDAFYCNLEFNGIMFDSGPQPDEPSAINESSNMALMYNRLLRDEPVPEAKPEREYVSLLHNHCEHHKLKYEYNLVQDSRTDGFVYQLVIDGKGFTGKHGKKKQAKQVAAQVIFVNQARINVF
ncbi:Multifunctional pyrimidine synthesis protein CAD [Terramyces sp. JEL0728]|nr:Multifunctional pyrimidine synthesis protein CAD [Terramyces sp. JEL0728]